MTENLTCPECHDLPRTPEQGMCVECDNDACEDCTCLRCYAHEGEPCLCEKYGKPRLHPQRSEFSELQDSLGIGGYLGRSGPTTERPTDDDR